jgi:hypothetical protein
MTPEDPTELLGSLMDESDHCRGAEFLRGPVTSTTAARLTSSGHPGQGHGLACRTAGVLIASVFLYSMGTYVAARGVM